MSIQKFGWRKAKAITPCVVEFCRSLEDGSYRGDYLRLRWVMKALESYWEKKWPKARKGEASRKTAKMGESK